MGTNSAIEWTHHTFNPWRGCTKVSPGCLHCYAEQTSKRNPRALGIWGPSGDRVVAAESYWHLPLVWNRLAAIAGERQRVFCASLADVGEGPDTMPPECWEPVQAARRRLCGLIRECTWLDFLLLTKRPENLPELFPADVLEQCSVGTSIEDQKRADERVTLLLRCPARVRFLSAEPLLGPIDLSHLPMFSDSPESVRVDALRGFSRAWNGDEYHDGPRISWVIVGGESGGKARPMRPEWARSLRDQCQAAGVAFFFKQWGEWLPYEQDAQPPFWSSAANGHTIDGHVFPDRLSDGDPVDGWMADLGEPGEQQVVFRHVGKKAAGRLLDGREWNELPRKERLVSPDGARARLRQRGRAAARGVDRAADHRV